MFDAGAGTWAAAGGLVRGRGWVSAVHVEGLGVLAFGGLNQMIEPQFAVEKMKAGGSTWADQPQDRTPFKCAFQGATLAAAGAVVTGGTCEAAGNVPGLTTVATAHVLAL